MSSYREFLQKENAKRQHQNSWAWGVPNEKRPGVPYASAGGNLLGLNPANSGGQPFNFQGLLGGYADPQMAALQGAAQAASRSAGYHTSPVSLGQMIGQIGFGAQRGALGANQQNFANYGQAMNMQMLRQKMRGTQAAAKTAAGERAAFGKYAAKYNLPPGMPEGFYIAHEKSRGLQAAANLKNTRAVEAAKIKAGAKAPSTFTDVSGRTRYAAGDNVGELLPGQTDSGEVSLDSGQIFNAEDKLYRAFQDATKTERDQVGAYKRIEAIYNDPSEAEFSKAKVGGKIFELDSAGAADLALIFNYMKMLDPRSVVREGEFAMAERTGGIADFMVAQFNKIADGGRLSPAMRRNIVAQARNQFNMAARSIKGKLTSAQSRAKLYAGMGIKPDRAIAHTPYDPLIPRTEFGLKPSLLKGTIERSGGIDYEYLGGNALLEESWKKK